MRRGFNPADELRLVEWGVTPEVAEPPHQRVYDQDLDRSCGYTVADFSPRPRDDRWVDAVFLGVTVASVALIVVALVWLTR